MIIPLFSNMFMEISGKYLAKISDGNLDSQKVPASFVLFFSSILLFS